MWRRGLTWRVWGSDPHTVIHTGAEGWVCLWPAARQ